VTDPAFHGTSLENAEKILAAGWIPSVGEKQMLGDGVYFFDGSDSEALHEQSNGTSHCLGRSRESQKKSWQPIDKVICNVH
jgi:hypothetical protein